MSKNLLAKWPIASCHVVRAPIRMYPEQERKNHVDLQPSTVIKPAPKALSNFYFISELYEYYSEVGENMPRIFQDKQVYPFTKLLENA